MGLSEPIGPCESTAPIAKLEASVVNINSLEKSGYCRMGSLVNNFLHFSKQSM